MSTRPQNKRKYMPAEAYRMLVLAYLTDHDEDETTTKGRISWAIRANHYMTSRVLQELHKAEHIHVDTDSDGGYAIRATQTGREFYRQNAHYFQATFGDLLATHYRYGGWPEWLPTMAAD